MRWNCQTTERSLARPTSSRSAPHSSCSTNNGIHHRLSGTTTRRHFNLERKSVYYTTERSAAGHLGELMTEKSEVGLARDRTCGNSKSLDSQSSFFVSWRDNKGVITPKSNPIDDNGNISSNMLQKNFKPLGHYTCMQCGTSHLQTVQENILSHIRKFTVATVRFAQNLSCNIYIHPIYQQVANVTV